MQSNTVVLQGTSYPICLVAGKGQTPSGYAPTVANTPETAKQQIAQIGGALTGDAAKRLDVINLLNSAGVNCLRSASARETASVLTQALVSGAVTCFHQKAKSAIQVSDNTNSGSAGKKSNKKSSSTASGKSASQAPAKNTGGASNNTASEEPITNQECRSDPVSMLSGEEILPLIDFTLAGSRQLVWRRLYRSSHADVCTTMGNGWRHDFMASLTEHYLPPPKVGPKQKGTYWLEYQDEHGAKHKFEKVKPGQSSYQLSSNLALHYQTNGKQVLVTPDDQHLTFKPGESAWLLEKIINEKGQSIAFYYDAKERLHRIEVNKVRGCIISYNAQGLLSKIAAYCTDKNNKQQLLSPLLASYEYDENKNLVQSTNQQNETERYAYNAANLLTKRTRASGFSHHFEWDSYSPSAKCIKQWGDNNTYTYQFEYNLEAGETTCIDSRGHKEHFVHNAQGKLLKHTDPNGNVWQYTYNTQGQKLSEIKPDSSTTRYSYTPFGQLETITQPDGSQTHFAYNQLGQRVLTTLPDGQTITRKYSVAGLLQSETFGDGRTTLYSYDKLGQLTQHINKNGQITKFIWNEQGELLAKHHNDELIRYSYDSLGRVNATLNNAGLLTQYKYNEHGQLTQTIAFDENEPENKQHQYFSYDEAGRLISSQNSKGHTTEQHFEGLSQPHCVIQPDGSALHLTYDKERNLTAIERSDGHVYRISYDANENPTQITGFDGTLQQYKYDACNRLASVTQSNKRHVKIERDSLGRVTAQHASLASDSHIVNNANYYSYTKQGKIARAHNAQSTLKQRFDKGGRLLCAEQVNNQQQAHTLKYSYDEYGRRQTLTLPDSTTLKYSYNQFGQLSTIHLQQANSKEVELAQPLVTLSYDRQGNIKTQQFGNSITLNQQFDVFNRLTQQQLTHPAQALFDTCTYNYDSINQLIARKNEGVSSQNINFEYNSLGQLIQQTLASSRADTTTHYQWDSFGNPQSQTVQSNTSDADLRDTGEQGIEHDAASNEHTASSSIDLTRATHSEYNELALNSSESSSKNSSNADSVINNKSTNNTTINSATDADRLTQLGDSDFYYDEFGNQIRETGKGIKTRREYNAFNQLSCFNNNGTLTQYDYDPLGRRIAKHTEHGKIDYIWDNDQLIGECQHGEYTWYINLPNQFHPVALIKQGEVYYYHLDQLNTPRFVTNNKAEVVWENQADVYGYEELKAESNKEDSFTQPIRFQGQYLDEESGLHYNRYRYYSPKQQRFINQDPIGLVGGINHYQYAPNPVNWVDPFGLSCKEDEERRLKASLKKAFNEGLISEELQRDLLEAAQIGFITPKEIKQGIISGNPTSLLILGGGDNSSPMTSQSIIDESIGEPLSIDALIHSELDKVTSLIWKEGEEFKNHVLINYHLDPDMQVLTRDEFLSLAVYTTNLYKPINSGLRGFSPKDKEKWAKAVADTDQALIKLAENPLLRYEGQVIRGDQFSDDLLEELFPIGGIHHEKGFKSSSSNLDKPFDGNTKILITSKTGINIANNAAVKPEEEEVLFKSGTKFKVISRIKVNGTNFIELEEV
ncbi:MULTISPECIES: RHS repeat-associated core domain-containing protein [unclassified Pseudoalteromonas]|uniref:RHS repeat-associated core domain-containing protein n=1 Tax=unclassified Pseudoalteromonas TaxID=194690 RepID=UPI00257F4084|nr:RHS repeat-associated core domain-containing protein [Pseudoalteromonas sp. UBA2102]|tara:strand:+ start:4733 stop:9382 length:4650 start_codon:yes stop_codon:yes gene_type:complete